MNRRFRRRSKDGELPPRHAPPGSSATTGNASDSPWWLDHPGEAILFVISLPVLFFIVSKGLYGLDRSRSIPLLIPTEDDMWGLLVGSRDGRRPQGGIHREDALPDYGGLVVLPLKSDNFQRTIRPNDAKQYHEMKKTEYANDKVHISKRHWFDDELVDEEAECRRPNWEKLHFPVCNAFHEMDLSRHYDSILAQRSGDSQPGDSVYISHGYFRDVFTVTQPQVNSSAVLKVARLSKHEMNYRAMFNARRDALIMERLTSSPHIVDIFGHCGSSVVVEPLPHEVEEVVVPSGGWMSQSDLNDAEDVDTQNDYDVTEKLDIALEMAAGIAELHGFRDGVIAHDDIQLCQWLRNDQGKLKLGDFNRARVLHWNETSGRYCNYDNGKSYGNYRSPEEYSEKELSQQHDVWSFGNNIYALLTGLWIFYDTEDDGVVASKVVNGSVAYIDNRYRTRSFIESKLVETMERCWVYDMDKRADIFEVLDRLKKTKKESEQQTHNNNNNG
ncbi:receptor-like [Seminavis robusta]|uniref:Receptor-like n=1 Tax=Seminavis robusta TaxID=568900 RepID=A0A9N8EDC9_9STRA|nr:receptor-like [Seminavis robusta]|eukprot:Sro925_g220930.1 receptor-like (501) ;mRNA; r:36938-38794